MAALLQRFGRRDRRAFHLTRRAKGVVAAATALGGGQGMNSLSLLIAVLETDRPAAMVRRLGAQPEAIQASARAGLAVAEPALGVTSDAQPVIEAAVNRSLRRPADTDEVDLLVGLATADSLARPILTAHVSNRPRSTSKGSPCRSVEGIG